MIRTAGVARLGRLVLAVGAAATVASTVLGAQTLTPDFYGGLSWRCIGPFDGGPVASVAGVPGEAGVYVITTPSGGTWKTVDGGDSWTSIDRQTVTTAEADPRRWVDSANPRRIARSDPHGIAVSLDGGQSWIPSQHLPIAEVARLEPREHPVEPASRRRSIAGKPVNVSIADPARPGLIFAGTSESVYVSFDNGARWEPLGLNMPRVAINDLDIRGRNLVAATQGRAIWELDDITPLRQLNAASVNAPAVLFKPADATLNGPDASSSPDAASESDASVNLDYYLGPATHGPVKIEVIDAAGRVVHNAASVAGDATDRWLPVTRPLSAAPGHHRVVWNLRVDPPPAQHHRFARMAPALFADTPPDPNGPRVLGGPYRIRLSAGGQTYTQTLTVRDLASPAIIEAERQQFDLAMKITAAMQIAHREFLGLSRVRAQLKPLLVSADSDVAAAATALDTQLSNIDGSDWAGLVIPDDESGEVGEVDEKEGKHPDFVPPAPVSVSKDYDDPTSILGRRFANLDHPPAFATLSTALGDVLTKANASVAPDAATTTGYQQSCERLSGVLDTWRALNANDLASLNARLTALKMPALPVAAAVSTIACGSGRP
jgi:hypothetical protein